MITREEAVSMVVEVKGIARSLPYLSKEEKTSAVKRLHEIKRALIEYRRCNPNA